MRRAIAVWPARDWKRGAEAGTVTLAFDDRHRRRIRLVDDAGEPFLLDLPDAVALGDGDALVLDRGGLIRVVAAPEDLAEVGAEGATLARLAWHLGNRHLPVEIGADAVRLRWDHVIVDMLKGLGARVERVTAPFSPEGGAYSGGGHGHHHHHHRDGHDGHHH
jgi:urease accessory protein